MRRNLFVSRSDSTDLRRGWSTLESLVDHLSGLRRAVHDAALPTPDGAAAEVLHLLDDAIERMGDTAETLHRLACGDGDPADDDGQPELMIDLVSLCGDEPLDEVPLRATPDPAELRSALGLVRDRLTVTLVSLRWVGPERERVTGAGLTELRELLDAAQSKVPELRVLQAAS